MKTNRIVRWLTAALASVTLTPAAADYTVTRKVTLGGEGGWDYLTYHATTNRLFISRGTHVMVIDPAKGEVIGDIPDTPGVHGIAIAEELGRGFVSNGRDNSVTVFELATLKTIAKIPTEGGRNPDFITYDPVSKRVFAFNGASKNASVIDARELKLVATIALEGKPEAAVADGKGTVFVDIEDKDQVTAIDARKAVASKTWPIDGCHEPAALAFDASTRRLFVGCHNRVLAVVDADSGKVTAQLPIGSGVDAAAFDAERKLVFSSQGDGTMTVIGADGSGNYSVLQNVSTQRSARTLALNPASHEVYLVAADFDEQPPEPGQQRPRRIMKPGTFVLLVAGPGK